MFKYVPRMALIMSAHQYQTINLLRMSQQAFSTNNVIVDPSKNKYQESQMLFFADPRPEKKKTIVRPRTIQEIKKLQGFVQ